MRSASPSRPLPRTLAAVPVALLTALGACNAPEETATNEDNLTKFNRVLTTVQQHRSNGMVGECKTTKSTYDNDADGLDDAQEQCVLESSAPLLRMSKGEQHWPVNVDWLLARTELHFRHGQCPSEKVAERGALRQSDLVRVQHQKARSVPAGAKRYTCDHAGGAIATTTDERWDSTQHFFLHVNAGDQHGANQDASQWRLYGHVSPNRFGGVDAQYYVLYAWDEGFGPDHQGDWEGITVRRGPSGEVKELVYCNHGECPKLGPAEVEYVGRHPVVWVARGSHASFASQAACNEREKHVFGVLGGGCERAAKAWYPWPGGNDGSGWSGGGIVNVGEVGFPLNGQQFIQTNILWGADDGPRSPGYQSIWKITDAPEPIVAPGSSGGGVTSCDEATTCGPNKVKNSECECVCSEDAKKACVMPNRRTELDEFCNCFIVDG